MNKQLLFDIEQRPANMVFAIARLTEVIEHLYYYQLLCIFSADGFQMPCHRKYPNRYVPFLNDNANRYRQTNEFT